MTHYRLRQLYLIYEKTTTEKDMEKLSFRHGKRLVYLHFYGIIRMVYMFAKKFFGGFINVYF